MTMTIVKRDGFLSSCYAPFKSKAESDKLITQLAASAIAYACEDMEKRKAGSATEANMLLLAAASYGKNDLMLLREYLLHFGPFVELKGSKELELGTGRPEILSRPLKFSAKIYEERFSKMTSQQAAEAAYATCFTEYRKVKNAAVRAERDASKTKEEKKAALVKRIERAKKEAEEAGIELPKETVSIHTASAQLRTFDDFVSAVKELAGETSLSKEQHEIVAVCLDIITGYSAKKVA